MEDNKIINSNIRKIKYNVKSEDYDDVLVQTYDIFTNINKDILYDILENKVNHQELLQYNYETYINISKLKELGLNDNDLLKLKDIDDYKVSFCANNNVLTLIKLFIKNEYNIDYKDLILERLPKEEREADIYTVLGSSIILGGINGGTCRTLFSE